MDPDGLIPGGVPTFIRGLIKGAPPDIQISLVGLTTDPGQRPVGRWTTLQHAGRELPFFPVARDHNPGTRSRMPLSVKMTTGLTRHLRACSADCDILDFHRFEPMLPFLGDRRPKNAFVHQNMNVIRNPRSDIMWKYIPSLYFALERRIVPQCASVFCVRADAAEAYREAFPAMAHRFHFTPTWVDPDVFHPASVHRRGELRQSLQQLLGLLPGDEILIWVGRLDHQKNPLLLVDAFALINRARPNTRLVVVGDGILRSAMVRRVRALGVETRVVFVGLRNTQEVADLLRLADVFLLTSAYEGMPMSVLEALGCGVPVVTTRVGEVERVVHPGLTGQVLEDHSPEAFAVSALEVLASGNTCRGTPCVDAVRAFNPTTVLAPIYENYRVLADSGHRS